MVNILINKQNKRNLYLTESFLVWKINLSIVGTPPLLKGGVNLFHNCQSWGALKVSFRKGEDEEKRGFNQQ